VRGRVGELEAIGWSELPEVPPLTLRA